MSLTPRTCASVPSNHYKISVGLHKEYIGDTAHTAAVQGGVENTDANEISVVTTAGDTTLLWSKYGSTRSPNRPKTQQRIFEVDFYRNISIFVVLDIVFRQELV